MNRHRRIAIPTVVCLLLGAVGGATAQAQPPGESAGVATIEVVWECEAVHVTSSKDISNVVVRIDGSDTKYDGLTGTTWTLTDTPGIEVVWVKSGRHRSGDGPGYGERFDRPIPDPCNAVPTADAGADQVVAVGDTVVLDGSGSSDPDGDPLTYSWALLTSPPGSTAALTDATTVSPTFVPDVEGSYELQLVVHDGTASSEPDHVTITAEITDIITLSPATLELPTRSSGWLTLTLSRPAGAGGLEVDLASNRPATASVDAVVVVPEGATEVDVPLTTGTESGIATITATATGFDPGTAAVSVAVRGMTIVLEDPLVGVGRTITGEVSLDLPAPEGGVDVTLTTSDPSIATVAPSTLAFAPGQSSAGFELSGLAEGSVVLTATAAGYGDATVTTGSTNALVSIGAVPTMSPGEHRGLPVSLTEPAPAGGVTVLLESSNPAIASVEASVTIAAGQVLPDANPQITGHAVGSAEIHARTEGYASDTRAVLVALAVELSPDPARVIVGRDRDLTVSLSGAAPAGGTTVSLSSDDPSVVTVPTTVVVPEGQTSAVFPVTGIAVGSTVVRANTPGAPEATATIHVDPTPPINVGNATVGEDLQQGLGIYLGATPPAPVDVTVTVTDPAVAVLSGGRTSAGSTSVTFTGVTSTYAGTIHVQGLTQGSTTITTTATGYGTDTSTLTVTDSGFAFGSGSFTTTTFSANRDLMVMAVRLDASGNNAGAQEIRGGHSVSVTLTSSDTTVGTVTSPVTFTGGANYYTYTTFDPVKVGVTDLALAQPTGFTTPNNLNTTITATVRAPLITIGNATVGRDLQQGLGVYLEVAPPSPVDVTVTVAAGSVAALSGSRTTSGNTSVTFTGVTSTYVGTIYVQGLALGSTTTLAQAPGYSDDTSAVSVTRSGFAWGSGSFAVGAGGANRDLMVMAVRLDASGNNAGAQEIRGGHSVPVTLTSSDTTVGTVTSPVTFTGGANYYTYTTFDPLGPGTTSLALTQPTGFTTPNNLATTITATVS